jgi:hydroxymethylglutaryl-CoA lyase
VPSARTAERFFDLGLGPDGLGHTLGVFVSCVEAHNLANTERTIEQSMAELAAFLPSAELLGVRVVGTLSGAWGWVPAGSVRIEASVDLVLDLADRLVDLGVASLFLSDLQGVAGPEETGDVVRRVVVHLADRGVPVGYHPHHADLEPVLRNVEAALVAGATLVDGSLRATGGCITGAPGNAPTEALAERLEAMGIETGVDLDGLRAVSAAAEERIFAPVREASRV